VIDVAGRILLDTGPSQRGWSRIGHFFRCPFLYAASEGLLPEQGGRRLDDRSPPLLRGSLGHLGLAHWYARIGCTQRGLDPDQLWGPIEAMRLAATRHAGWGEHLEHMVACVEWYIAEHDDHNDMTIVTVEHEYTAVLGRKGAAREWGIWAPDPTSVRAVREADGAVAGDLRHLDGAALAPVRLDMPGHPRHGRVIYRTRRLDLEVADARGRVFVRDHKFKAKVNRGVRFEYEMDGQFELARQIGSQVHGDKFGGTQLNAIQHNPPYKVEDPMLPTVAADSNFAWDLWFQEHDLARYERDIPAWLWPRRREEQVCRPRYGCSAVALCRAGAGAVAEFVDEET